MRRTPRRAAGSRSGGRRRAAGRRSAGQLLPAFGVRQHGERDPVRPQRRRAVSSAYVVPGRPRSASGTASIAARSAGWRTRATAAVVGSWSVGAHRTDGCAAGRGRSRRRRCAIVGLDDVAVLQVLRVVAPGGRRTASTCVAGGSSAAMISTGLGGALRAVPTGVPVSSRSPGSRAGTGSAPAAPAPAGRSCRRRRRRPGAPRR